MENEYSLKLDTQNVEQQKAFDLVANTNTCLFITGKAGTGKTTFIKRILAEINKNFLVLAPTGIAAIAVGGQTMHSFFGFPMHAMGPHTETSLSNDKFQVLKQTDTIIVDEASMVRSDMVNGSKCLANPEDYTARAEMMLCCTYGCNDILSLGNTDGGWPCHLIEHALSAYYDITHGDNLGDRQSRLH